MQLSPSPHLLPEQHLHLPQAFPPASAGNGPAQLLRREPQYTEDRAVVGELTPSWGLGDRAPPPPPESLLPIESVTLGATLDGRPPLRIMNPPSTFLGRRVSLLSRLARSVGSVVSWIVLLSRCVCGKMPHFPLALVPDQHQCSG